MSWVAGDQTNMIYMDRFMQMYWTSSKVLFNSIERRNDAHDRIAQHPNVLLPIATYLSSKSKRVYQNYWEMDWWDHQGAAYRLQFKDSCCQIFAVIVEQLLRVFNALTINIGDLTTIWISLRSSFEGLGIEHVLDCFHLQILGKYRSHLFKWNKLCLQWSRWECSRDPA